MMNLNYNITLSNGNKKLKNTDSTRFIIFNLPSIITCPYATIHCKEKCYARKSELFYPDVLPCRNRNLEETKKDSFVPDMIARIENKIKTKSYQGKQIVIRIHESGDFYNKSYAMKWLSIARHFENNKNIVFMAYTKSLIYFESENIPTKFCLRASVSDDTKEEQKEWLSKNTDVALGSDAFFPFSDNIERAYKSGVKYIVEPGGSVRDDLVIECADKYDMVMAFTGIRLFHH